MFAFEDGGHLLDNNFLVRLTRNIIGIGEQYQSKRYPTRVALAVVILKEEIEPHKQIDK
jgi:hypothetical protein